MNKTIRATRVYWGISPKAPLILTFVEDFARDLLQSEDSVAARL